ncbi:CheR family methyltransferase [Noviherbaspirillum sp.]|jgi:chemotaxis protein methyltransferase CheR|uniref:CheR family methyltransferase n=1 Tax=Noviherbaspirillum sp. TaxID=1926288 RepID=UPI0025D38AF3|nr:CheR family methyltransferase [Noviherbaspirillum sp.]
MAASVEALAARVESIEDLETDLLLEGVFRRFGHDFRGYRRAALQRKLHVLMQRLGVQTVSALQERVMHEEGAADSLLRELSARSAGLLDDPGYLHALRAALVPLLRSCASPRIWIAECLSAEDACALSVLLADEDLLEKTQIFATAENESLLQEASSGRFAINHLEEYAESYRKSGGKSDLRGYCREEDGQAVFSDTLRSNITWAQYSLATNASFNEFQLIICRQALADFGTMLRRRALQLFYDSMPLFGILSVDADGGLDAAHLTSRYKAIAPEQGLYRREV